MANAHIQCFLLATVLLAWFIPFGYSSLTLKRATSKPAAARSPSCKVAGDSDIYGLGVRIGLYLQWLLGFILRNIGSWDIVTRVWTVNNSLCAALTLAAAIKTIDGAAFAIDYLLSYYLTVILFYCESYNLLLQADPHDRHAADYYALSADISLISQNLFFAAYNIFGAWYWLSGVNRAQEIPYPDKAAIIFCLWPP